MIDHVVVSLDRPLGRIHGGKVDAVAVVAMDQIVMNVQVVLIKPSGIAGTASGRAQGRRMKLQSTTGKVVMDVVPSHIYVV